MSEQRSLRNRIEAAIQAQPEEVRFIAERDLALLEAQVELSLGVLAQIVSDPAVDPKMRAIGAWVIGLAGEESLASVLERVARSHPPGEVLWEVSKALCALGQGKEFFRELLKGPIAEGRRVAAYALGRLGDRSAAEHLCRVVASAEEESAVRGQAAEALGYLGSEGALPSLFEAARDPSPEVRFWAAFALGHIGSSRAEPILMEMAENDHAHVEGWWDVAKEASDALQQIRSRDEA